MSIDFDTDPGGAFVRLGRIGNVLYLLNGAQNAIGAYSGLAAQYLAAVSPDLHPDYAGFEVISDAVLRSIPPAPMGPLQQLAVQTLLGTVKADVPSAGRDLGPALAEFVRQMKAQSKTVKASTVGASATVFGSPANTGNGNVVLTTKRGDGLTLEHIITESARLTCTGDSYSDRQTPSREPFLFVGKEDLAGPWDYDAPQGSGANTAIRSVDATQDASTSGNLLTNSDCESWSGSPLALDNWACSGTYGTDVIRTATPFAGTYAAQFAATATTQAIRQTFNDATGTTTAPNLLRSYAVNFRLRRVSSAITAGVLTVSFVDGSNAVINDEQGNAASFTVTLSALTTSYAPFSGTLRLPSVPPAVIKLQIKVTTNHDNPFLLDHLAMTPVTSPYAGGPGIAVFGGSTPFRTGDGWTVATTNDRGGASYGATFQQLFDRLFGARAIGLLLPSSAGSPSIADTLITS